MVCTDAQVRLMMKERAAGKSQEQAAVKANVKSRKTVAKYERVGKLPSALKGPRLWRTRTDPFAEDWAQVESMLAANPGLEAKTLFAWLCEQAPARYQPSQLRTLQRRVAAWRPFRNSCCELLSVVIVVLSRIDKRPNLDPRCSKP